MKFVTNSAKDIQSSIQIVIKGVEELKRSFNFNASEVIPQPCISSVTGDPHVVYCWSMELADKEEKYMEKIFTRAM